MRRTAFGIVLVLGFLHTALPARVAMAQEKDKDAVTAMARKRFQEGVTFFDQRRYEEARAAFLQAYALKRHPAVLLNLAQSEARSGRVADAARHFAAFLRESTSASGVERTEAEKGLQAARAKLGRIQVNVSEPGAEVSVDGEAVGVSPLPEPVDVSPGSHSVEAKHAGRTATATVVALVGKQANATLSLDSGSTAAPVVAVPAAPQPATPVTAAATPVAPTEPEGPSEPRKTSQPFQPDTETIAPTQGRDPFFRWVTHSEVGWFSLGLTVAGIGVLAGGVIFFKMADNNVATVADSIRAEAEARRAELSQIHPPPEGRVSNPCADPVVDNFQSACNTLRDNVNQRDQDRNIAIGGVIAAGVGITTLVTGYLLSSGSKKPDVSLPVVTPAFSPRQAGLVLSTAF